MTRQDQAAASAVRRQALDRMRQRSGKVGCNDLPVFGPVCDFCRRPGQWDEEQETICAECIEKIRGTALFTDLQDHAWELARQNNRMREKLRRYELELEP